MIRENTYNSQAFTPKDIEKGLDVNFLKNLLDYNNKSDSHWFNDIHITTDGYCNIIEWVSRNFEHGANGEFMFIPEDKLDIVNDILNNEIQDNMVTAGE